MMHPMPAAEKTGRIISIDILRGIVMVIMALDHTRDYFSSFQYDPTDMLHTTPAMFLTRWITHFCAPIFVFLSGTSAFLSMRNGKSRTGQSIQLLTRGIWLILLEVTIVRMGWFFNLDYSLIVLQVIWAIGWSMICLSLLIFLPRYVILFIGLLMIAGHNMLDVYTAASFHNPLWWNLAHEQGAYTYGTGSMIFVVYPLLPWVGVMAVGYCFGAIMLMPVQWRDKILKMLGFWLIGMFFILRGTGVYGDPIKWFSQDTPVMTALAFLNVTKYPPSLQYLLMTIGPGIFLLPFLEKSSNAIGRFFTVFGKVPMFYYILHIYLLHTMAVITGLIYHFPLTAFTSNQTALFPKQGWGFELPGVYLFWIAAIAILYYPCRWFVKIKATHKKWWLSYI